MGVYEKLNVCRTEGKKMRIFASLAIFAGSEEEEETKV